MPASNAKISPPVIRRLPRYYRFVQSLHQNGVATVSSSEIASTLGTTASQVRQDFNCFGEFGQQGVGYHVPLLLAELEKLLYSNSSLSTILIGAGRLGRTISHFLARSAQGFQLVAIFDNQPAVIGTSIADIPVQDVAFLEDFCRQNRPRVAVLCVPEQSAELLGPALPRLGIKGIWNFSHHDLDAAAFGAEVENVHLGDSLSSLGYRVRNPIL